MEVPTKSDLDGSADSNDRFDPQEAARLLSRTQRDARRRLMSRPPWITAALGALVLGAYLTLWLTTRDQHPYRGPSLAVVGLVYAVVAVCVVVAAALLRRATAGVAGPSVRRRTITGIAVLFSIAGSPVLQGALRLDHASNAIVYGMIPAAGPLIVIGTTMIGIAAATEDWAQFAAALIVVLGGFTAAFLDPSTSWLAAGVGLFLAVLAYAFTSDRTPSRTQ